MTDFSRDDMGNSLKLEWRHIIDVKNGSCECCAVSNVRELILVLRGSLRWDESEELDLRSVRNMPKQLVAAQILVL